MQRLARLKDIDIGMSELEAQAQVKPISRKLVFGNFHEFLNSNGPEYAFATGARRKKAPDRQPGTGTCGSGFARSW